MQTKEKKKEIRKIIRGLKNETGVQQMLEKSSTVLNNLLATVDFSEFNNILLYSALPDEVNTSQLITLLSNKEKGTKRIILPVVTGDILVLKEYIPNEMASGYMNILEPQLNESVSPEEIDIAVIPGVAFDKNCNRLGRGKGFYDKLLPFLQCKTIGLGFDFQIIDSIPCETFDKPLDCVITENKVYKSPL